ncbi:acetyltransferase (GNAT) family protein [Micromonospora olivasterospora]|uniref:Acetyltransferase (GNAT) family protein n=1 Tax=Micromonospora olivasterospora TaxID=1880 RepID=A0A562IDP3_MICOL|nr:acetyltransferase (GNAT) family protein [Micromonospora olivasterospora]
MANLVAEGDEAEVALLVRDDWQRRGLGTALLRRLLGQAERAGVAAVLLHVQAENGPMLRTLRRLDRPATLERDGSVVTVTVPVTPAAAPPAPPTPSPPRPRPAPAVPVTLPCRRRRAGALLTPPGSCCSRGSCRRGGRRRRP